MQTGSNMNACHSWWEAWVYTVPSLPGRTLAFFLDQPVWYSGMSPCFDVAVTRTVDIDSHQQRRPHQLQCVYQVPSNHVPCSAELHRPSWRLLPTDVCLSHHLQSYQRPEPPLELVHLLGCNLCPKSSHWTQLKLAPEKLFNLVFSLGPNLMASLIFP